jgi:hypothetical protein
MIVAADFKAVKGLKFKTKMIVPADYKAVKGLKFRLI